MRTLGIVLTCLALAGSPAFGQSPASASATTALDERSATFLKQLQQAVSAGDRARVASMVRFPLVAAMGGVRVPVANARELADRFDAVFTSDIRNAIAMARPTADAQGGFTIGKGLVTVTPVGADLKVTGVSVPNASSGGGAATAPRRITVRPGPTPTQTAGSLNPGGMDTYLLRVLQGRLLEVRIEGSPGREVIARIVEAASGKPADARAEEGQRTWSGRTTIEGDYRIEVVRAGSGAGTQTYTLSVKLQ